MWVWSLGWGDPLEKEMAAHSNILAWKIPWIEEPDGLQSTGLQKVRHEWVTWIWSKYDICSMWMMDTQIPILLCVLFNWGMIALQCCVNLWYTLMKWLSYMCTYIPYIPSLLGFPPLHIPPLFSAQPFFVPSWEHLSLRLPPKLLTTLSASFDTSTFFILQKVSSECFRETARIPIPSSNCL